MLTKSQLEKIQTELKLQNGVEELTRGHNVVCPEDVEHTIQNVRELLELRELGFPAPQICVVCQTPLLSMETVEVSYRDLRSPVAERGGDLVNRVTGRPEPGKRRQRALAAHLIHKLGLLSVESATNLLRQGVDLATEYPAECARIAAQPGWKQILQVSKDGLKARLAPSTQTPAPCLDQSVGGRVQPERDRLLNALAQLIEGQFALVVFTVKVPTYILSGPQMSKSIQILEWCEQVPSRMVALKAAIQQVAPRMVI